MVDRLARLGLEVDSSGVARATQSMRGMERQGRNLESGTKRVGNTTTNTFQSIRRAVVAAAAVYATYRAAIRETIDVAERYERAELRTQAVLRATGNQAGLTGQQLREMADDLALGTLQSVEGVQQAQQVLLTFGDVTEDTFGRAIEAAADLGAVFGGDLASNTRRLGRLLQDPANELSALSRQGITFSDDFQSTVQALVDGGNAAEAQSMILDELSGRMGGVAREEAQGLAGAYDTLAQRLDEFRLGAAESTGALAALTSLINSAASGVTTFNNAFFGPQNPAERLEFVREQIALLNGEMNESRSIVEQTMMAMSVWGNEGREVMESLIEEERRLTQAVMDEENARAEARAQAAEARGAAVLDGIQAEIEAENQASEEKGQLLQEAHNNRLDQIAQMHVSAERLEREGFESIQALREHYQQIEAERYRDAQQLLREEQATAANKELAAEEARLMDLAQLRADFEGGDAPAEFSAERQLQKRRDTIEQFFQEELIDKDEKDELMLDAESEFQDRLTEVAAEGERERQQLLADRVNAAADAASSILGFFNQQEQNKIQSELAALRASEDATEAEIAAKEKAAKQSFENGKKLQLAMVGVNTAAAIMNELATNPDPFSKWASVAAITATGATQASAIIGQQFNGGAMTPSAPNRPTQQQGGDVNNTTNQVTINVTGADGDIAEQLREFFDRDGVLINPDSTQGRALRNG